MEALMNSAASRATRLLIRLVRASFLLSLTIAIVLLLVRHWQHGSAFVPQGGVLLFVAVSVSLAMIVLRTDLVWQLCRPFDRAGSVRRAATLASSTEHLRWRWMLPLRGQIVASGIHVWATLCWGFLAQSPVVILVVLLVTCVTEVICWLPWIVAKVNAQPVSPLPAAPALQSTRVDALERLHEPVTCVSNDDSTELNQLGGVSSMSSALLDEESDESSLEETIDADLIQFQERHRRDGKETIQGVIRVSVTEDQRTVIEHVVFHPPLPGIPEVVVDWLEGPECQIRITRAERFGLRFELRLSQNPTENSSIVFQYLATAACLAEQGES